jgi:hypothetical protein
MEPLDQFKKNNEIVPEGSPKEVVDISPDPVRQKSSAEIAARPIIPGFQNTGVGIAPTKSINSANFTNNSQGWGLASNGDAQFNGNRIAPVVSGSGQFTPVLKLKANTIYISNGTSPNGVLSGATGDIVFHGDGGKMYFCIGTTTWTAPA